MVVPSPATNSIFTSVASSMVVDFSLSKKSFAIHVGDARLGARLGPGLHHLVRMLLRKPLDRRRRPAIGVAFTQHRIHRGSETHGKSLPQGLLGVVLGLFREVGDVVSLILQLLDGVLQLRNGSADIGQLDDVGLWGVHELDRAH